MGQPFLPEWQGHRELPERAITSAKRIRYQGALIELGPAFSRAGERGSKLHRSGKQTDWHGEYGRC
jgi:hypothetical protein